MTTTATSYDTVYSTVPSYALVPQALVQVMDYNEWTEATIITELTKSFLEVLILQLYIIILIILNCYFSIYT